MSKRFHNNRPIYRTKLEFLSHSLELTVLADRMDPFIVVGSFPFVSGRYILLEMFSKTST